MTMRAKWKRAKSKGDAAACGRSLHPVVQSCPACGGDHKGIRAKTVHRGTLLGDENEKVYTTVGETWLCPNDTVSFLLRRGFSRPLDPLVMRFLEVTHETLSKHVDR